jgi:ABC-type branched-subunit amino acid transport system substrate-binding protein
MALLMLACLMVAIGSRSVPAADNKEPIVMAHIDALSGAYRMIGFPAALMIEFAVDKINSQGGVLGRPVKLVTYDSEMKPDVAMRQAKKAIEEDGAKFITQTGTSAIALALSKLAASSNVVHMVMKSEAMDLTGEAFQPNTFRHCLNTTSHAAALVRYFVDKPQKKFFISAPDFSFGHDVAEAFKSEMKRLKPGAEILGEVYHPFAVKDYGPYVSKIMASGAEVVVAVEWGPDLINLIKQGRSLGMNQLLACFFLDNPDVMSVLKEQALNSVTVECYMATVNTEKNKQFIKEWTAWFKRKYPNESALMLVPSSNGQVVNAYNFMFEAIKKAGSVEADKVVKAWEGLSYEGLTGQISMRACDHQLITPAYVATVVEKHPLQEFFQPPFVDVPVEISAAKITVPPDQTGNPRCK